MKKIFALSLGCLFLLISWVTFTYLNVNGQSFFIPDFCFKVQIEISPEQIGNPITEVAEAAQELGIEVIKTDYDKSEKTVRVYTSDTQKYASRIRNGRLPSADGEYIASKSSNDVQQVGILSVFSTDNNIQLYPLASRKPSVSMEQFQVASSDQQLVEQFVQEINEIGDGTKYQASFIGGEASSTYGLHDAMEEYGQMVILMVIITTLSALYLLFQELKGETVKKILGYSNRRLAAEFLPRVYLPASVMMIAAVAIFSATALYFYNGLALGTIFFELYFLLSLAFTAIVYVIVFLFHFVLISCTKPIGIIKNKFPYKSVLGTTYLYKLIIVLILAPMIASAVNLYQQYIQYGNSAERLEMLKDYVELPLYSDRMETREGTYELGEQYKKFFAIQNNRGAILFDISGPLEAKANGRYQDVLDAYDEDDFSTPDKKYYVTNHHITINYEYLKQNPIYDCDGNQVFFTNESEDVVHVLIPEQFKQYESSVVPQIQNCINSDYYILEDLISDEEITHPDRAFQITWVKDNQSYFTYDPEIGMTQNCYIQDPISFVYNNATMCGNIVLPAFSSCRIKIPVESSEQNLEFFEKDIKACGLEDSVMVVNNAYQRVSDSVYTVEKQLNKQFFFSLAYLIVFAVLIFISSLTIIHAGSRKLYIMRLLGYSSFRCNLLYYARSAGFWLIVFILLNLATEVGIAVAAGICIGSLLMEMIVQTALQAHRGIQQAHD